MQRSPVQLLKKEFSSSILVEKSRHSPLLGEKTGYKREYALSHHLSVKFISSLCAHVHRKAERHVSLHQGQSLE